MKRFKVKMDIHPEELILGTVIRDKFYNDEEIYIKMKNMSGIDLACGTGFFSEKIAQHAKNIRGIDLDFDNVFLASKLSSNLNNINFINTDATKLPFKDESLDFVFLSCALEHFNNPIVIIQEIDRILKKKGNFYLTVDIKPKYTAWLYNITFLFDKLYDKEAPMIHKKTIISDDSNVKFISKDKLLNLLKKYFTILEVKEFAGLQFNIFHTILVVINKLYQIITKKYIINDSYGRISTELNHPIFKFYYHFIIPFLKKHISYKSIFSDFIYCYISLEK